MGEQRGDVVHSRPVCPEPPRPRLAITCSTIRVEVLAIGILVPTAYILVLTAMSFTPISYVAPAREVSILIGTIMGTHLLSEGQAGKRIVAAVIMVLGLVALALG